MIYYRKKIQIKIHQRKKHLSQGPGEGLNASVSCPLWSQDALSSSSDETHGGFPTKDTLSVLEFRVFNEGFMVDGPPTGWNLVSQLTDTVWPKTPP